MRYYHFEQQVKMSENSQNRKFDEILQRNFADSDKWGGNVLFFDEHGNMKAIEICKLHDVSINGCTWEHYATIQKCEKEDNNNIKNWELYSQFNGEKEDELWVLAYYRDFGCAVLRVSFGIEKLKPIKVY